MCCRVRAACCTHRAGAGGRKLQLPHAAAKAVCAVVEGVGPGADRLNSLNIELVTDFIYTYICVYMPVCLHACVCLCLISCPILNGLCLHALASLCAM